MAQFVRLKIRGIRSIGDEDSDTHDIKFLSPCTLINGPNGTGKTTTIEALNYITTGAIPTGGFSNFIHANSLTRKSRVDASVMLEFIDFKNRVCTAVRRVSASKGKDGKVVYKSEEATLNLKFKDGTETSTSSKVCDFDKTILFHLGVPKAIFNHVIFCHQESSTWPLSEPKALKIKFDEIFDLTKFVKAQDQMRSLKKKLDNEFNVQVERQRRCEDMLKIKFEKKKYLEALLEKQERGRKRLETSAEFRHDKEKEKQELERQIGSLEKSIRELDRNTVDLHNISEQIKLLRTEPYFGTQNQLKEEIEELKRNGNGQDYEMKRARIVRNIEKVVADIDQLTIQRREIENEISELKAHEKHCERLMNDLQDLETKTKEKHNFDRSIPFPLAIEQEISKQQSLIDESMKMSANGQDEAQELVDKAQKKHTEIEINFKNKRIEGQKIEEEIETLERKLKSIGGASKNIEVLSRKKDMIEKQLANIPEFDENKMSTLIKQRESAQSKLDDLNKKCKGMESVEHIEKELTTKTKEYEQAKQTFEKLIEKHEPSWESLYGDAEKPPLPWTSVVNEAYEGIKNGLKIVENQLKEAEMSTQTTRTIMQQMKDEGKRLKSEIEVRSQKLIKECGCEPTQVAENLKKVQQNVKKMRKELAPIDAKIVLYDSWIEDTNKKSCCPLCERKFNSNAAVNNFSQKLQDISISFPSDKENLEESLIQAEAEEQKLLKGEHEAKELIKMKDQVDILREKLKNHRIQLDKGESLIEERRTKKEECVKSLEDATSLQTDVSLIDSLAENMKKYERDIRVLKGELSEFISEKQGLSFTEMKREIENLEQKIKNYVNEGDEIQSLANRQNTLQAELNKIREERVSLGEIATQGTHLRDQISEKKKELEECLKKFKLYEMELPAARKKVEIAVMERTQIMDEKRDRDLELSVQLNDLKNAKKLHSELSANIEKIKHIENSVGYCENRLERVNQEIEKLHKSKIGLEMEAKNLNGSMTKLRDLEDQLTRMMLDEKKQQLENDIKTLKSLGCDKEKGKQMYEALRIIQSELRKSNEDDIKVTTIMQEVEQTLVETKKKLNEIDVRNAEQNYRDSLLETTMLKESSLDLQKYLNCLEVSLLRFHTEKMGAINDIIDELWRKVYDSSDIETIKIKSNEKGTRSYDYSVMMVQEGGTEVEMRGRCSAGQKMLASLLIRIALAEVFGGLCSMMALDEPTTNLDDMKVEKMADILNEVISSRSSVNLDGEKCRGTQMVVITHDERLTNRLTTGCRPEYIYTLDKNEQGLSFLKKRMPDGEERRVRAS